MSANLIKATSAVLTVGDGRGFVIDSRRGRQSGDSRGTKGGNSV